LIKRYFLVATKIATRVHINVYYSCGKVKQINSTGVRTWGNCKESYKIPSSNWQ